MLCRRFSTATILAALAAAGLILWGSAVVAYKARRHFLGQRALLAGQAALERQDWAAACDQLKQYLWRYPDDEAVLDAYVEANLDVRPRKEQYGFAAQHALRRLFQNRPGDRDLAARLARLYFSSRNYTEAAYVCRQRLAADPTDVDATIYLARSHIARRNHDAAREVLENFIVEHPDVTDAYVLLSSNAWQQQSSGRAAEALDWLDRGIQHQPEAAALWARRAALARNLGSDNTAALADLERARALAPDDALTLLLLAEEWREHEQWDRVEDCLAWLESAPVDPLAKYARHPDSDVARIRRLQASLHLARGQPDAAEAVADQALNELEEPHRSQFLSEAIEVYLAIGRHEKARVCIDDLTTVLEKESGPRAPRSDRIEWHLARLARGEGRLHVAIDHLQDLLERSPSSSRAWLELADVFEATGQWRPTSWALEQYLLRVPNDYASTMRLARLHRDRRPALAARIAGDAEKLQPDDPEPALLRIEAELDMAAQAPTDLGRLDRLGQRLDLARRTHPDHVQVLVLQARLSALRASDPTEALELLDAARQMAPGRRDLDTLQAEWLWRAGRAAEVSNLLNELVRRYEDFEAYRLRARFLLRKGETAAAERDYLHLATIPGRQADGYLLLGEFHRRGQREEQAIDAFRAGLEHDPARIDLRLRLAESLVQSCQAVRHAEGLAILEGLLEEQPALVDAILLKAQVALHSASPRKREEAEALLEQAVRIDPRCSEAQVMLIELAMARGNKEEAEALLARAMSADPDSVDLLVEQARLHDHAGHAGVAEELARQTLQSHPDSPAVHSLLATQAFRRGDLARARQLVDETLEFDSSNEAAILLRAEIDLVEGQASRAESHLAEFLARRSGCRSVAARVMLATLHMRRGDYASAESQIRAAFAIAPANVDVLRARVHWLVGSERIEQLRVDLAAVDLAPSDRAELHTEAASALIERGFHLETAAELLAAASTMNAREVRAELLLARLHSAFARHAEAEAVLRAVLDRIPYQRDGLRDLASNYVGQERWSEALELADRALARYPADPELLAIRGSVLLQLGRLDGAEADLGRCLRHAVLDPRLRAMALVDMGDIYLRRGDPQRARESIDKAIAIDADHAVFSDAQHERIRRLTHID